MKENLKVSKFIFGQKSAQIKKDNPLSEDDLRKLADFFSLLIKIDRRQSSKVNDKKSL